MTRLRGAAETHTGYVRSINQDLALVSGDLVAVADGMGGHLGGEVAARTAIEELLEAYIGDRTGEGLEHAARHANRAIWRKSRVDRKLHGMGTTLTAAALVRGGPGDTGPARLVLVNVGDSRAYVFERGTHTLRQLTEDHSVVEEMVRQGELTHEEAAVHPHRHVLTRALGIDAEVALDIWELTPDVDSRYLLCSDGLTNEVADAEIAGVLAAASEPREAARELVGRALGHGGMDNVTVVVVDIVDGDGDPAEVPVELVPPRAPRPEVPVRDHVDITEVIPVSRRGRQPEDGASPAPGSGSSAAPVPALDLLDPAAGSALDDPPDLLDPAAGSALDDPPEGPGAAAQLQRTIDDVGDAAVAAAVGAGGLAADPPGELDDRPKPRPTHRRGRSMTVRQKPTPPSIDGSIGPGPGAGGIAGSGALTGSHGRPLLLVPDRRRTANRDRIVTFRVAVFVILLAGMFAGTAGVVIWFDQSSYYVGMHGNVVAIYEGRPGGLLWFKPQLIETSPVKRSDLLPSSIATLQVGISESSLRAAEAVVARLKNEKANALAAVTTTTPATTTSATTTTTTSAATTTSIFAATVPPITSTTLPAPTTTTTTQPKQTTTTQPKQTTTTRPPHHSGSGGPPTTTPSNTTKGA
ncbi:MAG: PP2C family serine/threonine-protein phosphatase [Acidimicrobiales bacterium]|jgi:protein phosphatase